MRRERKTTLKDITEHERTVVLLLAVAAILFVGVNIIGVIDCLHSYAEGEIARAGFVGTFVIGMDALMVYDLIKSWQVNKRAIKRFLERL